MVYRLVAVYPDGRRHRASRTHADAATAAQRARELFDVPEQHQPEYVDVVITQADRTVQTITKASLDLARRASDMADRVATDQSAS